jgi:8-oxo-dGTP pyrophosphatase MutT (NUDIX family)
MTPPSPIEARPAATVILLRDSRSGPEVLLQRRAQGMGFMAGAYVFPGGRLDPADLAPELFQRCDLAQEAAGQRLDLASSPGEALGFRVAAVRELFEEAGVLLARRADGGPVDAVSEPFPELRRALHERSLGLLEILQRCDLVLETSRLFYLARWITPEIEQRRFDARFFLTAAPGDVMPSHDDRETVESLWLSPAEAVERGRSGAIVLPPPTTKTLELLRGHPSTMALLEWARGWRPVTVCPEAALEDGQVVILLPGDPKSRLSEPVYPGPTRYVLDGGHWAPG